MSKPTLEKSAAQKREERLKAALKSNIARRKRQAKARAAAPDKVGDSQKGQQNDE